MQRSKYKSFRKHVKILREFCPPLVPVKVRRRPDICKGALGVTSGVWDGDTLRYFSIIIDSRMSWDATWQTLVHEWAHCVAWHEGHETVEDHGPEWALAFSRCYQESVDV